MGVNTFRGPMPPRPKVSPSPTTPPRRVQASTETVRNCDDSSLDVLEAICGGIQETGYDGDCP